MEDQTEIKKILAAYFSHNGNTREIARQIQHKTAGEAGKLIAGIISSMEKIYRKNHNGEIIN
jgi:flavodoxin